MVRVMRRRPGGADRGTIMNITLAAGVFACGLGLAAGSALAAPAPTQGSPPIRRAHPAPSLEGTWRVNFILSIEAPPGTPQLVVSETEAKAVAAKVGKALSDDFVASLDPELPALVPLSD